MRVTMNDVGRMAGVTKMTVSRALRNPKSVRRETWERIRDAASNLNYKVPRRSGRTLNLVWLMFCPEKDPNCSNELLMCQIEGVNEGTLQSRCNLQILYFDESQTTENLIWRLSNPLPDGVLMTADYPDIARIKFNFKDLIKSLNILDIPVVAIGASTRHIQTNRAYFNDITGSYAAIEHLLLLGHKRIAFFSRSPEKHIGYINRYSGYKTALELAGLEVDPDYYQVVHGSGIILDCSKEIEKVMRLQEPPTAIFAVNDYLAIEMMKALEKIGVRVPDDCSVIGYDNISKAQFSTPPLTTVDTRISFTHSQAVKLLSDIVENPVTERIFRQIEIEPQLVIRQSSKSPNH